MEGNTGKINKKHHGWFHRFVERFRIYISPWIGAVIIIGFPVIGLDLFKNYPNLTIIILVLLALVVVVDTVISVMVRGSEDDLKSLRQEIHSKQEIINQVGNNITFLFDGLVHNLAKKIDIYTKTEARVTLYIHRESEGHFTRCGRYSRNPKYNRQGRSTYPDNQGCISKGWEDGWYFNNVFPKTNQAQINQSESKFDIPKKIASNFSMFPKLIAVKQLAFEGKPIAVIVVESTNPEHFKEDDLREQLSEIEDAYATTINALYEHII